MYIKVQFKNKDKIFCGKTYDFKISEKPPKVGAIVRMYTKDFSRKVCNATRVKVVDILETSEAAQQEVSFIETTLDD